MSASDPPTSIMVASPMESSGAFCHDVAHGTPGERSTAMVSLVDAFLALERPVVTQNMLDFMLDETAYKVMVGFITRHAPSRGLAPAEERNGSMAAAAAGAYGRKRCQDDEATKKSHKCMQLFATPTGAWQEVVVDNLSEIVSELFHVFEPDAEGNFYHFRDVIFPFLRAHTEDAFYAMHELAPERFVKAFDHLYSPAIFDFLVGLMGCRALADGTEVLLVDNMAPDFLISVLGAKLFSRTDLAQAADMSEFLTCLFAEITGSHECIAYQLFIKPAHIFQDFVSMLVRSLDDPLVSKNTLPVLRVLAHSRLSAEVMQSMAYRVGYIRAVGIEICLSLSKSPEFIDAACDFLVNKSSAHKHGRALSYEKTTCLEILLEVAKFKPVDVLQRIGAFQDGAFWDALLAWFYRYPHNNVFHGICMAWIDLAVAKDDAAVMEAFFVRGNVVARFINTYRGGMKRASYGGWIVHLLNIVASQPADRVAAFAPDAATWTGFQDELAQINEDMVIKPVEAAARPPKDKDGE